MKVTYETKYNIDEVVLFRKLYVNEDNYHDTKMGIGKIVGFSGDNDGIINYIIKNNLEKDIVYQGYILMTLPNELADEVGFYLDNIDRKYKKGE